MHYPFVGSDQRRHHANNSRQVARSCLACAKRCPLMHCNHCVLTMVRGKGTGPGCVISVSLLSSTAPSLRDHFVGVGRETELSLPHCLQRDVLDVVEAPLRFVSFCNDCIDAGLDTQRLSELHELLFAQRLYEHVSDVLIGFDVNRQDISSLRSVLPDPEVAS
eukprot:2296147-Rhodomonas_salina.1